MSNPIQSMTRRQAAAKSLLSQSRSEPVPYGRGLSKYGIHAHARLFLARLRHRKEILASAWRSFRGHLKILSAKAECPVDLGPAFERDARGYIQENTRTAFRNLSIEKLLAGQPWSDPVDLETFLRGFDAGEEYAVCGKGKESGSGSGSKTAISA